MQEQWRAERAAITLALLNRAKGRKRQSGGEEWIDHHCLFHEDRHRSASWSEVKGTYYCRTEDRTYLVGQVSERLLIPPQHSGRRQRYEHRPSHPPILAARLFTYVWPSGQASHIKLRWGDGDQKQILQSDVDLAFRLPEKTYPIYGDYGLSPGLHLLVVEGEVCVEKVTALNDDLHGVAIRAITCGSTADIKKHATELTARLGELAPISITLWPDNDEPGFAAMRTVHLALNHQNLVHSLIRPAELGLPLKGDVVDFIDGGHSLATLIAQQSGALEKDPVADLVGKTYAAGGMLVDPADNRFHTINEFNGRTLWLAAYGSLPTQKQLHQFLSNLATKGRTDPVVIAPRGYTNEKVTWWRPEAKGRAYRISAEGVEIDDDPPGVHLTAMNDGRHVDTSVDLDGSRADFEELISIWSHSSTEVAMMEGWLVCAMGCLQTPILFMRSPAATGKTTLARFLLSVVEPMCPEMEAKAIQDSRQFALSLMSSQVALIDNVSRMDSAVEDMLSRLVTGYTATLRPLYSDEVTNMFLRRGIIITTTNWDIYKGDLASRTIVVEPQKKEAGNASDRYLQARFMPLIPKVRGYIMKLLATYYRERIKFEDNAHFRVGDLGVVFACLGYDTSELARAESVARAEVVSMEDFRIQAMVDLWVKEDSDLVVLSTQEINDHFRKEGIEVWPDKSPRLARWFAEKAPFFLDHGFSVERVVTMNPRGYRLRRVAEIRTGVDFGNRGGDLGLPPPTLSGD